MSRAQRRTSQDRAKLEKLVEHFESHPLRLSKTDADLLLSELCVSLGYCLKPRDWSRIVDNPPADPKAFAELVMELEGVGTDDPKLYEPVLKRVLEWYVRVSERVT